MLAAVALALMLSAACGLAHDFGDDYPDTPEGAVVIGTNSSSPGRLEIDDDQDWFCFQAAPLKRYTVIVTTGTLWDSSMDVRVADTAASRGGTSSVPVAPASFSFLHMGPTSVYYVGVSGFAAFTTGTYSIAVSQTNMTDLDGDGMDDAWEIVNLGSTNHPAYEDADLDRLSNREEFLLGTSPTNQLSSFAITVFSCDSNNVSLNFDAQQFRVYAVSSRTNLVSGAWQRVQVVTNGDVTAMVTVTATNTSGGNVRYYRAECLIDGP